MISYYLGRAINVVPFTVDAAVTIDMSRVSQRVRTLAKKIILSRKFDRYSRSQSGVLAYAIYKAYAPKGTPAMDAWNRIVNPVITDETLDKYADLIRVDATLSRMRNSYRRHNFDMESTVEQEVEGCIYRLRDSGYVAWVESELKEQRDDVMRGLLSSSTDAFDEATQAMLEPLNSTEIKFHVYL